VLSYIEKTILTWTTSEVLWSSIYSFLHILDKKFLSYALEAISNSFTSRDLPSASLRSRRP